MIEKLAAPITHVGVLVLKSFSNRRESVEPTA
jgi:hypothetical protein